MKRSHYVAAAVLAAASAGLVALGLDLTAAPPAPSLPYTLLNGRAAHTDDWRGKVVLVNFWATSCAACVHEMPQLAATYQRFTGPGFEALAIAMQYDAPARVVHFSETRGLPFPVAIDHSGSLAQGFGDVAATPTTLLIDRRGRVVERLVGTPDFAALQRRIGALLAES